MRSLLIIISTQMLLSLTSSASAQDKTIQERRRWVKHLATEAAYTTRTPQKDLREGLARVCVNEAWFDSPRDCDLIWQVIRGYGQSVRTRLRFLYMHSPRATGILKVKSGNAAWTHKLGRCDKSGRCGPFGGLYAARWRQVLKRAHRLISGEHGPLPCERRPLTWGGADGLDDGIAKSRGLVRIKCEGTKNIGYAKPLPKLEPPIPPVYGFVYW